MGQHNRTHRSGGAVAAPAHYQTGAILAGPEEQAKKGLQGRRLVQQRILTQGKESLYNLTGLIRAFPLDTEDLPGLESQMTFYAYFMGRAEPLAIRHMGGDPKVHGAVLCNRVTSSMLAIMLALVKRGDRVLSVVGQGRSHPCVQQAVELAGGSFFEVRGLEGVEAALDKGPWHMLVITPLTPQKYHMPAEAVRRAISLAKERGITVVIDDAHMASRTIFYDEPPTFALGDVDVGVWSLDKHVPGPRSAAVVAKRKLMDRIQAMAFQYGVEAQTGHYVAGLRGMEAFDPEAVRRAGHLARQLFARFQRRYGDRVYQAGPGVAISTEEFAGLVLERATSKETPLVAAEISTTACFLLVRDFGIATIPLTGFPGAAPTFRLMMHPDGPRLGLDRIEEATEAVIQGTARLLQRPQEVRTLLLGTE